MHCDVVKLWSSCVKLNFMYWTRSCRTSIQLFCCCSQLIPYTCFLESVDEITLWSWWKCCYTTSKGFTLLQRCSEALWRLQQTHCKELMSWERMCNVFQLWSNCVPVASWRFTEDNQLLANRGSFFSWKIAGHRQGTQECVCWSWSIINA